MNFSIPNVHWIGYSANGSIVPQGSSVVTTDLSLTVFNDTNCTVAARPIELNSLGQMSGDTNGSSFRSLMLSRPLHPGEYLNFATNGTAIGGYYDAGSVPIDPPENFTWISQGLNLGSFPWGCAVRSGTLAYGDPGADSTNGTCVPTVNANDSGNPYGCVGLFVDEPPTRPMPVLSYNNSDPRVVKVPWEAADISAFYPMEGNQTAHLVG